MKFKIEDKDFQFIWDYDSSFDEIQLALYHFLSRMKALDEINKKKDNLGS
ncbi:MAG: hypothetical protein ACSNEK_10090 [Parachlamydiaceae bacterium]